TACAGAAVVGDHAVAAGRERGHEAVQEPRRERGAGGQLRGLGSLPARVEGATSASPRKKSWYSSRGPSCPAGRRIRATLSGRTGILPCFLRAGPLIGPNADLFFDTGFLLSDVLDALVRPRLTMGGGAPADHGPGHGLQPEPGQFA